MGELRLALRRLRKRPAVAIVAVLALASSIGAATAAWSVLSAVLLRPLAIPDAHQVFLVGQSRDLRGMPAVSESHNYLMVKAVRETGAFDHVAAGGSATGPLLVETTGRPARTQVYFCTYDWMELLGVVPSLGRSFTPSDDALGAPLVAIISDRYWRAALGADPRILGRVLTVSGVKAEVVGVAPGGFRGLSLASAPEVYLPFHTVAQVAGAETNFFAASNHRSSPTAWVTIVGRLSREANADQAAARLRALDTAQSGQQAALRHVLVPVNTAALPAMARASIREFSRLLAVTVGLLLLIGCTTVGMLLLVRSEARSDEFALCLALGASRARLARGVVFEGASLSIAGAATALPVALFLFSLLRSFNLPGNVAIDLLGLSLDWRMVGVAALCALLATMVIAMAAATFAMSSQIGDALRARAGATPRLTRRWMRTLLATTQLAVALVLLSGAGLFARSLAAALSLNEGFEPDHVVSGSVLLGSYGYSTAASERFSSDLAARMLANPAIRSFALLESSGGMTPSGRLFVDGQPRQFPSMVAFTAVDERYFTTMGLRVIAGRDFAAADSASAQPVAIVSESFGRMIANGGNPLGRRIRDISSRPPAPPAEREIVGVVPDFITSVAVDQPLVLYFPRAQTGRTTFVQWVARASGPAPSTIREILSGVRDIDSRVSPSPMFTMREQIGRQMGAQRLGGVVLGALAAVAALLTAVAVYILIETMAAMRLREMGIRSALGASRRHLAGLVLREAARLVSIGLAVGLCLTWIGAGMIRTFLYRVQPLDPLTLIAAACLIASIAFMVVLKPALRVARVDVASMLRET